MSRVETSPEVTVTISLVNHRDQALPSIRGFAGGQTLEASRYEIMVVSDGTEPAMDEVIRAELRPHDRLVIEPSCNEYRLFNFGARFARGNVLLITESHCIPEETYLEELLSSFADPNVQAMRGLTVGVAESELERLERDIFEESFERGLRTTAWNRVLIHGFAIRRDLYLRMSGFREKSENFGPWELGARLHREGVEIGCMKARMFHHYMGEKHELRDFITRFCRSEWEYWACGDRSLADAYFPPFPEWTDQGLWSRQAARSFFAWNRLLPLLRDVRAVGGGRSALSSIRRGSGRYFLDAKRRESELRRRSDDEWEKAGKHKTREAFEAFWRSCIDLGRWQALYGHEEMRTESPVKDRLYAVREFDPRSLYGWQPLEKIDGIEFRWTEPVSGLRVQMPAETTCVRIELVPSVPVNQNWRMSWHRTSHTARLVEPNVLEFRLTRPELGTDWLTLITPGLRDDTGRWRLGLPVKSLGFFTS